MVATAVPGENAVFSEIAAHNARTVIFDRGGGLGGQDFPNNAHFLPEAPGSVHALR